jgi:hypothetical protein
VDREAFAVVAADVLVGGGDVFGFEVCGVPLDGRAGLEGDHAQEDGFGEAAGVPAYSKFDMAFLGSFVLIAFTHSVKWPGERGKVGLGFSMSLNLSLGSNVCSAP